MKRRIELFAALGEQLGRFGADADTQAVVREAVRANPWFTGEEIVRSLRAVADRMLRPEVLEAWLSAYPLPAGSPRRVLVVMAGNIPAVGFFDLLCVLCSGHVCCCKPASKDEVLMRYIVDRIKRLDPEAPVAFYDGTTPVDAVIATGSDRAARHFKAHYAGRPMLLRGSRRSVAVLSGRETPQQLAGLSDDIWSYSGLGCRNVSLIFAPEEYHLSLEVPPVNTKYRNNYTQTKALLRMHGTPHVDLGRAVLVEQAGFPKPLSAVAVARYRSPDEVTAWLARHDSEIQCVVTDSLPHARRTGFGEAQSPGLTDWPDGVDVLAWLAGLA